MHLDEHGENFRVHTPTKQELKEMYIEDLSAYDVEKTEERDPHAALKEMHRMESGLDSIGFPRHDEYVQGILQSLYGDEKKPEVGPNTKEFIAGLSRQKIADAIEWKDDNGFMKNDAGKNMVSLVDPAFVLLLGEILTFGAKKYAPNNWQLCEDTSRYKDALLRHIYAYLAGEKVDPESGLSHLGHAAFGLMCLNYFDQKEQN